MVLLFDFLVLYMDWNIMMLTFEWGWCSDTKGKLIDRQVIDDSVTLVCIFVHHLLIHLGANTLILKVCVIIRDAR
jgi:TRAP-type mannitol/chloroaromatic compound transport system permease small subunit